jgi:tetratricopeptide (TPR) repeat protein
VKTLDILDRSGEIARASEHFKNMRTAVNGVLTERNASMLTEANLVLEPLFSDREVRKRASCEFTHFSRDPVVVEAWQAWVSDAALRDIHARIVSDPPPGPAGEAQSRIAATRLDLLRRIHAAMGSIDLANARKQSIIEAQDATRRALDPIAPNRPVLAQMPTSGRIDEQAGIDRLAGRLQSVPDRVLKRHLDFMESAPGKAFYQSLGASYTTAMRVWQGQLEVETRTKVAPKITMPGADGIETHLSTIRRFLDTNNDVYAFNATQKTLENLELLAPKNATLNLLRGRVQIEMISQFDDYISPYERGLIRDRAAEDNSSRTSVFDRPEPYLVSAIELSPADAEPRAFLGRLRFLQHDDAQAAKFFSEAHKIDPKNPFLSLFKADLAYEKGQFSIAERGYRQAIAGSADLPVNRERAIRHLGHALDALGRGREYEAFVKEQLRLHPEMWDLRVDYAGRLLDRGAPAADATSVLDPIPKQWQADRLASFKHRVMLQQVSEAAPSVRIAVVDGWNSIDTRAVGKALCQAKTLDALDAVMHAQRTGKYQAEIARGMMGCGVLERRSEVVAAALPFYPDINEPSSELWQDTLLCGAAAQGDARTLVILLKAKADVNRPCVGGKTTARQRLVTAAGKGDKAASKALAEFDRYVAE